MEFIFAWRGRILYYHASQTANLSMLIPHISNHGIPLVYLSSKRENVLVYLSNAVEKHCKEVNFNYDKPYKKWASYGFLNNILHIDEYYPNALIETYKGVSGYIYSTNCVDKIEQQADIPFALTTTTNVILENCEFVADAYEAIISAESNGKILITRYQELSQQKLNWINNAIKNEYISNLNNPDYQLFLKAKFPTILLP